MIRPCNQCGGTGTWERQYLPACDCPQCPDKPWLDWQHFIPWARQADERVFAPWYLEGTPAKPDPDTVMQWCFTQDSVGHADDSCEYWRLLVALRSSSGLRGEMRRACEVGWVERPTRLQEVR